MDGEGKTISPRWNWTTKLLVGIIFVSIILFLVARFRNYIGPLILVFILSYLSYPIAARIRETLHISWRLAVTLFYLLVVLLLIGLLTLGGFALVEQAQSLYTLLYNAVTEQLPQVLNHLTSQTYMIGPFTLDLTQYNLQSLNDQILSYIQPLLGKVGTLVTTVATGAAGFLGWVGFVLLISYFITSESRGVSRATFPLNIPGHTYDMKRLGEELRAIWNAFLRGQLILFFLTVIIYSILLSILQVRYAFGLALLAGLGRFLPYVGPAIAWTAYAIVSFFQGSTVFGLSPLIYTCIVVAFSFIVDSMFDNFVSPKIMGQALKVHPAAVLISALILANLIGVVGVLMAAPVLATVQLFFLYTMHKMFDQDPWEGIQYMEPSSTGYGFIPAGVKTRINKVWVSIMQWIGPKLTLIKQRAQLFWHNLIQRMKKQKNP